MPSSPMILFFLPLQACLHFLAHVTHGYPWPSDAALHTIPGVIRPQDHNDPTTKRDSKPAPLSMPPPPCHLLTSSSLSSNQANNTLRTLLNLPHLPTLAISPSSSSSLSSSNPPDSLKPACILLFRHAIDLGPQIARAWHTRPTHFAPFKRHWISISSSLPETSTAVLQGRDYNHPVHAWYFGPRGQQWDPVVQRWNAHWEFETRQSEEGGWIVIDTRAVDARVRWRGEVSLFVEV